jgi:hypothetical protein
MATLARRRLFPFGRQREENEELREELTALQNALWACRDVAGRWSEFRRSVTVAIAVSSLLAGFVLGVYRDRLVHAFADVAQVTGLSTPIRDIDAATEAYQKGKYAVALDLARPLAEAGDVRGQSLLGLLYYRGRGTPQDPSEAAKWFMRAANQNDAAAQFYLGVMWGEGVGVPQDFERAAKWYRRAADLGDAQAQYNLGLAYAKGEGVPQDNVAAHMWLNLAAAHFLPTEAARRTAAVNSRDAVASKMTPEQLAEAQKRAHDWHQRR